MITAEDGLIQLKMLQEEAYLFKKPFLGQRDEIVSEALPETFFSLTSFSIAMSSSCRASIFNLASRAASP